MGWGQTSTSTCTCYGMTSVKEAAGVCKILVSIMLHPKSQCLARSHGVCCAHAISFPNHLMRQVRCLHTKRLDWRTDCHISHSSDNCLHVFPQINWTSVFSRKSAARSVLPPAHALPGAISGGGADAALRRASLENPDRRTSVELFGRALLTVAAPPQGSTAPAAPQPGPAGGVLLSSTNDGPAEGSNAKGLSGDVCSSTGLPLPGIPALLDGPPSQADTPTRVFTSTRMGPPAALLLPPSHPTSPTAACAPTFSPSPSPSALGRAQAASCPPTATQHHLSHFGPAQGPGVPVGTVSSNGVHGGACSSSGAPLGTASAAGSTCGVTPLSMSGTASPSSHMASPRRRTPMETKKASEEKQVGWCT
jgi:hypothetical protein